ncbi:MAG: sugar ABC transporter permease [Clostridia bacterium]|nr:sugar ABC transporter permease [Clostridia bacterium]
MKNANETQNKVTLGSSTTGASTQKVYLATPKKVTKPVAKQPQEPLEEAPVVAEQVKTKETAEGPAYTPYVSKKKGLSLTGKKALSGWLFCMPFVLGIIGIYLPMVIKSIEVSFRGSKGNYDYLSFDAYKLVFFDDGRFTTTVLDAMGDLVLQIPAIVIFSLFMAIILNQKMTGRTFFRAVFFLPVILSTGIIDAIDAQIDAGSMEESGAIDDNTGASDGGLISSLDVEMLLSNVNLKIGEFSLVEVVTSLINNIFKIVSRSGVQMLIFLSGLQSISPSIYESCQMEGATAWETFWKITLPMISPMILVNAIYTVVDLFTAADNRVMQGLGGYGGLFGSANPGNFSAGIWVYILLVLVVIVVVALLMKTVVFYQRRD